MKDLNPKDRVCIIVGTPSSPLRSFADAQDDMVLRIFYSFSPNWKVLY